MSFSNLYDVLVEYMSENYNENMGMLTTKNINFKTVQGREVFLQLKWFKANGELIIKEVMISPKGGNLLTSSVKTLLEHAKHEWQLQKVLMESVLDKKLIEKMKSRGWTSRYGNDSNLYSTQFYEYKTIL